MASAALLHQEFRWAIGNTVTARLVSDFPPQWGASDALPPNATSKGTATVQADGSVTITGLTAGSRYRLTGTRGAGNSGPLVALDHWVTPPSASSSSDSASVAVLKQAPINVKDPAYGAVGDNVADDYAAIAAAIAAAAPAGGTVFFPPGVYRTGTRILVPGGVELLGTALDFSVVTATPARGSIIKAASAISSVVTLGDDAASSASGKTAASLRQLIIDGSALATQAVDTGGRRNVIDRCQIWRGATNALTMAGQNGYVIDSVLGQDNVGSVIEITGIDNKVMRNQIREAGSGAQIRVNAGYAFEISENHMYGSHAAGGDDIEIVNMVTGLISGRIIGNTIEGTAGHHIRYVGLANQICKGLVVVGNTFYQIAGAWIVDNTQDVFFIDLTAAAAVLRQVIMAHNNFDGNGVVYRSLINKSGGSGTLEQTSVVGNHGAAAALLAKDFTPDDYDGNSTRYFNGATTAIYRSSNQGKSTQSGNGATTAFTIAHGLIATPTVINVTPGHADSKGDFYVTADATNITVTYAVAPANAANNVVLNWRARV